MNYNPYPWPVPEGGQMQPREPQIIIYTLVSIFFVFPFYFWAGKKGRTNKKYRDLVPFITGIILILSEAYKQILVTYHYNREYHYYIFPFQLCAMPMYTSTLIPLAKNEKFKNGLFAFMAQFGIIGGIAVMLYQESVLTWEDYFLDIHTIIWHLLLIALGIFSASYLNYGAKPYKKALKTYSLGAIVFISVLSIAQIINLLIVLNHGYNELTDGGNMFYISMFMYNMAVPVLNTVLANAGWYIAFIGYAFVLLLGGFVMMNIYYRITKLYYKYGDKFKLNFRKN